MKQAKRLTLLWMLAPAALAAQASGSTQTSTTSSTTTTATAPMPKPSAMAQANASGEARFKAPPRWSATASAKLEAIFADAKEKDLPRDPIADRVDEGTAKGASETAIIASAGKAKANLEASHEALVRAGRTPTPQETERGATAMEHGVTKVQLQAMASHTPSDRSLVVAFDVLGKLADRGMPVTQALTEVQTKIDARAPDAALTGLVAVGARGRKP